MERNHPPSTSHFGFRGIGSEPHGDDSPPTVLRGQGKGEKSRDFLVVDVPTAYGVILGWLTLHKVKAVIASYLLQLQFEADDGSVGQL